MSLNFKRAEKVRFDLSVQQQREIKAMYQQAAKDIAKELEKPLRVPSDAMRKLERPTKTGQSGSG